jgi:two-component system chemotaxis sensor kinase CheA
VSLVTSELQEAVSLTRMQPVSSLFAKFPRLVRDLANDLGKEVQLKLEGGDVELDKTILEGLSDPLTHMVRNSVDHGIEQRPVRLAAGKTAAGTLMLRAKHQAGQVVIEISDDGKGLAGDKIAASAVAKGMIGADQVSAMSDHEKQLLIFLPGLSTAEKLSDVSGRGVGMDVVKTNLDKLGGKIEVESVVGKGSVFRIKLPLTLAIIPSLLVSDAGERFAIPQVSVGELIRIPADQIADRVDRAGDAEVVLLRDRLVPLVDLAEALGGERKPRGGKALNVVLVDTGSFEYGLVVGELHDTVEIVVKPMGRHLQALREYAGATILGDGQVAVILDVAGLATRAGITQQVAASANTQVKVDEAAAETHALLLFENAPGEHCAVPIELVTRVERVRTSQIEYLGGRRTMQYGGSSLPVVALHDVAAVGDLSPDQQWVVVVFERAGRPTGLLVAEPLDMIETRLDLDPVTLRQTGVAGSAVLNGNTTLLLDIFELVETVRRKWGESEISPAQGTSLYGAIPNADSAAKPNTVLVAEDSEFFRGQIRRLIEAVGYKVLSAEDGQSAWELLDSHAAEVAVVTTDVEMPRLDGLGLTRRIRADSRFANLPVIALSTLAGAEEMARGMAMGVSEYQIKLDQDQLIESIRKAVGGADTNRLPVTA